MNLHGAWMMSRVAGPVMVEKGPEEFLPMVTMMSVSTVASRVAAATAATVLVLAGAACAGDGEGGSSDDGRAADVSCPVRELTAAPEELAVALVGPVTFVDGTTAASAGGHTHTGPLVADGQAHLHYCVVVANGYDDPVVVTAIQVLPDASEEPLAVVEAEALTAAFVDPDQAGRVGMSDAATLELLVPAGGPVDELHQRIAYTVESDTGARDLFVDVTLPT